MSAQIGKLTKDKEFDAVFKKGKSFYTKLLGVKAVANNLNESRFGILINNKVSKKAVIRNKIRRRIRETVRSQADQIETGADFVFVCLPEIASKNYQEIKESINFCLKKLRLYK